MLPQYVREVPRYTHNEIASEVARLAYSQRLQPSLVVLTGGNPALYDLTNLIMDLHADRWKIQVETQGSRWQDWLAYVEEIVLSPKPPSANVASVDVKRFLNRFEELFVHLRPELAIKVVVFTEEDFQYGKALHAQFPHYPFYFSVGNVPQESVGGAETIEALGQPDDRRTLGDKYRWLAERAAGDASLHDTRVLPQLHVLAWGNERGH